MALLKKINAVIVGIILLVSLGLILNVLFSDKASRGLSDQRDFDVSREEGAPNDSKRETQHQDPEEIKEETDSDSAETDRLADNETQEEGQLDEDSDSETNNQESEDSSEALETSPENEEANQDNQLDTSDKSNGQDGQAQSDQGQAGGSNQSSQSSPNRSNQSRTENKAKNDQQNEKSQESQANENQDSGQEIQDSQTELVAITIDARQDGGNQYFGETQYQVGDTALDILLRFTQDRGISVILADDATKGDIFEIDGHQTDEGYGVWVLYINGQRSVHQAGANKIAPESNIRYLYQKQ